MYGRCNDHYYHEDAEEAIVGYDPRLAPILEWSLFVRLVASEVLKLDIGVIIT